MPKSLPRVRPGVHSRSDTLLEANIRMFLVDQLLKDDDEPIAITDLVHLTKTKRDLVIDCLESMSMKGVLPHPSGKPWHEVDAFELGQFRIATQLATRTPESKNGQRSLAWDGEDEPEAGFEGTERPLINDPRVSFRDLAVHGDTHYDLKIEEIKQEDADGTLMYVANVSALDFGADEAERIFPVQGMQFPNMDELLDWWKEAYKDHHDALARADAAAAATATFDVVSWAKGIHGLAGDCLLAPDAFDALQTTLHGESETEREDVCHLDAPEFEETLTFRRHPDGHPLPEQATPEVEEAITEYLAETEEPGIDTFAEDPRFTHTLEDGSVVTVHIRATGRGRASVTLEGPVTESGTKVASVKMKEIGEDAEGWSLQFAEQCRRDFVEATQR